MFARIAGGLVRLLTWSGKLSDHILLVRIPLLLIVLGTFLTLRVDQIGELFFLLGKTGLRPRFDAAVTLLITLLFGLGIWYSARVLYRFRFAARPALADPAFAGFRRWWPRVLGASVPLLMAIGCLLQLPAQDKTGDHNDLGWYIGVFVLEALVIFGLVVKRRAWMRAYQTRRNPECAPIPADPREDRPLARMRDLGIGRRVFHVAFAFNLIVFVAAWIAPRSIAWLNTLSLIQLTALFLTLTGTWVLTYTERSAVPVMSLFIGLAFTFQLLEYNDNHHVRQSPDQASYQTVHPKVTEPPDASAVLRKRLDRIGDGKVFLVSSEGGGIKAAAWTALVLARLDFDTEGAFGERVLAASGVSGGSLGIATFVAMHRLLRDGKLPLKDFQCGAFGRQPMDRCPARPFLTGDFLRPTLANMLLVDQAQRWIPLAMFPDRGSTLEHAWERGWAHAVRGIGGDNAFIEPWRRDACAGCDPWLLFNTTVVSSGQRLIEQPYGFPPKTFDAFFPDAVDGARRLASAAPLSAIVHNSARFTYVSPAGLLDAPAAQPASAALQIVDGGYFENSGTATLLDAYRYLTEKDGLNPPLDPARIVVIHISNDPAIAPMLPDGMDRCDDDRQSAGAGHFGEITSPAVALLNTREARGDLSRRAIVAAVQSHAADAAIRRIFHFRLCTGDHHLPLGWTLSNAAWTELTSQLGDQLPAGPSNAGFNRLQLRNIAALTQGNEGN